MLNTLSNCSVYSSLTTCLVCSNNLWVVDGQCSNECADELNLCYDTNIQSLVCIDDDTKSADHYTNCNNLNLDHCIKYISEDKCSICESTHILRDGSCVDYCESERKYCTTSDLTHRACLESAESLTDAR